MKRTKSQFVRLMELDRAIRARRYPNCLTFAADYEVSQKTIQRDIDFLRDQCGAPIAYDREHKGFYYEDTTWLLPSLVLSEGELVALLLAGRVADQYHGTPMARHIDGLFDKLADLLPDKLTINPLLLHTRFTFTTTPCKTIDEKIWSTVVAALLAQQTVRIAYRPFESSAPKKDKTSEICPYHIANLQGEWYVFAVHRGHGDIRQFALARIEKATLTKHRFELPPDFDPEELLKSTFGRYVGTDKPQTVKLLFDKDIADWVTERQWHPAQTLKRRRNGDVELTFPTKSLFEVQRWVLSWGRHVRVLAPTELRMAVAAEIQVMCQSLS